MKIIVKSTPNNWQKEKEGKRPFTIRKLDGRDTIEIINTKTGETFTKKITDIVISSTALEEIIIDFRNK